MADGLDEGKFAQELNENDGGSVKAGVVIEMLRHNSADLQDAVDLFRLGIRKAEGEVRETFVYFFYLSQRGCWLTRNLAQHVPENMRSKIRIELGLPKAAPAASESPAAKKRVSNDGDRKSLCQRSKTLGGGR